MKTAIFRILVLLGLLVQGVDHVRADHHEKKDKPEKSKKAEDGKSEKEAADKESDKDGAKEEEAATSEHSIKIGGKKIDYTATAGSIQLKKENGKSRASVFYVAYEKKGVKDNASRPIMFCFNGGPGSSAVWLHLGAFGPRRVKLSKDGVTAPPPPFRLVDNQFSLIDVADLVFIDPVSTGYSRPEEGEDAKGFHGFQESDRRPRAPA